MALAYSTGCHTHSVPLDRMGLECRVKEDLVMQNDSTLSIIKHFKNFISHKRTPCNKEPS